MCTGSNNTVLEHSWMNAFFLLVELKVILDHSFPILTPALYPYLKNSPSLPRRAPFTYATQSISYWSNMPV